MPPPLPLPEPPEPLPPPPPPPPSPTSSGVREPHATHAASSSPTRRVVLMASVAVGRAAAAGGPHGAAQLGARRGVRARVAAVVTDVAHGGAGQPDRAAPHLPGARAAGDDAAPQAD